MTKGIIKTDKGDFPFDLYDTDAPGTVKNFVEINWEFDENHRKCHQQIIPSLKVRILN